jgi:hypothetical protein
MVDTQFRLSYGECREVLARRLAEPAPGRIQLLSGPRQVGKTSLLLELAERLGPSALLLGAPRPSQPAALRSSSSTKPICCPTGPSSGGDDVDRHTTPPQAIPLALQGPRSPRCSGSQPRPRSISWSGWVRTPARCPYAASRSAGPPMSETRSSSRPSAAILGARTDPQARSPPPGVRCVRRLARPDRLAPEDPRAATGARRPRDRRALPEPARGRLPGGRAAQARAPRGGGRPRPSSSCSTRPSSRSPIRGELPIPREIRIVSAPGSRTRASPTRGTPASNSPTGGRSPSRSMACSRGPGGGGPSRSRSVRSGPGIFEGCSNSPVPEYRPLLICDAAARAVGERLHVPVIAWKEFLLSGPPREGAGR